MRRRNKASVEVGPHMSDVAEVLDMSPRDLAGVNPDIKTDKRGYVHNGQDLKRGGGRGAYTVRTGDVINGVSLKRGLAVKDVLRENPDVIVPYRIHPSQVLRIPNRKLMIQPPESEAYVTLNERTKPKIPVWLFKPDYAALHLADVAEARAGNRARGKSYKWVKEALLASGMVKDYFPGVSAISAGQELAKRGFTNLLALSGSKIRSPHDAPTGSVLLYAATPSATDRNAQLGHMEVRTRNGFASDYATQEARTGAAANGLHGRDAVLIGVYVKMEAYNIETPEKIVSNEKLTSQSQVDTLRAAQVRKKKADAEANDALYSRQFGVGLVVDLGAINKTHASAEDMPKANSNIRKKK
jgi:LysM repeat protein